MQIKTTGLENQKTVLQCRIMTTGLEKLGSKVRTLRKSRWRSQEKFVQYMEEMFGSSIHQTSLSAIELGEKYPTVENLALLARALETNTDYLLGLTDDDRPHSQLDDQVIVTVEDPVERRMLQDALEMLAKASPDDKEYIVGLIRRLAPKKPRIIGDE